MQRVKKWLENYWYHYKWHTIVGAFFLLMLTLLLVQCATKESKEFQILYAGPINMQEIDYSAMEQGFADLKGKEVAIHFLWLYTEEQLKDVISTPATSKSMAENRESLFTWAQTGENIVYLLDPSWYEQLKAQGLLAPLQQTLGYTPASAIDEYGVRFHQTSFATHYATAFAALPQDTVLCMRTQPLHRFSLGKKKEEERYAEHKDFFAKIVRYGEQTEN